MEKNKELLNLIINNQIKEITDIILKEYVIIDNNIILEDVSYLTSWIPSAGDSYDYFVSLFSFTNDPAFWGLTLAGLGAIADVFSSLYAEFPIVSSGLGLLAGIFYYKAGLKYIESGNIVGGDVGNQRWLIGVILCSIAIVLMIANACGVAYRFKSILSIKQVQNALEGLEIAGKTRNVAVKSGINKFNDNPEVKNSPFKIVAEEVKGSPIKEITITTEIAMDSTTIKGDINGNFTCKGKIETINDEIVLTLDDSLPEITFHISEIDKVTDGVTPKEINYIDLQNAYNNDYAQGFAESLSSQADSDLESVIGDLVAMEGFIGEIDENLKTITRSELENELTRIVIFENGRPKGLNAAGKQKLASLNSQLEKKGLKGFSDDEYIEFLYNSKNEGNKKLLEDANEKIAEAIDTRNNAAEPSKNVAKNISTNSSEESVKSTGGMTTWKVWKIFSKKKETSTNTKYNPAYTNSVLNSFLISFNRLSSKLKTALNTRSLDLPVLIRIRYPDGRFAGTTHEIPATLNVENIIPNGAMIARAKVKVNQDELTRNSQKMDEAFDFLSRPNDTNNIVPFEMYGHANHTKGIPIKVRFAYTKKTSTAEAKLTYTKFDQATNKHDAPVQIHVSNPEDVAESMNKQISDYNAAIDNMQRIQSEMTVEQMSSQHPFVINGNNYNSDTKNWLANNLYNEPSLTSDYKTVVFSMRQPVEKNVDNSANVLNVSKNNDVAGITGKINKALEWCTKKSINFLELASSATDTVLKAGTNAKIAINNNRSALTTTEFVLWMYTKTLVGADDEGGFTLFDFEWGDDLYDSTKPMTITGANGDKIILTVTPREETTKELNKIDNTDPF